jgi:pseudouridine kinase
MTLPSPEAPIVAIGSMGYDIIGRADAALRTGTSNPAALRMSPGGVARNVAENLAHLGMEAHLISAVGDDAEGRRILEQATEAGVHVDHVLTVPGRRTGAYLAVLDGQGALHLALDDMRITEAVSPDHLRQCAELLDTAGVIFVDANLPPRTLAAAVRLARQAGARVAADPTSVSLASRLIPHLSELWLVTPNEAEAAILSSLPDALTDRSRASEAARQLVALGVDLVAMTLAERGVEYASAEGSGFVPAFPTEILDPTGAGDALTAAVIFALLNEIPLDEAMRLGASAAALTLRTPGSVVPDLSLEMLYDQLR